jgi:hypothetical protein
MAEFDDLFTDDDLGDGNPPEPQSQSSQFRQKIRNLEKKAEAGEAATKKVADLERKLAFAEAGIDLSDPKMKYFVAGYQGDMETEKIQKAAVDAGFITQGGEQQEPPSQGEQQQQQQQQPQADQGDLDLFNAANDAAGGDLGITDPDPMKGVKEIFERGGDTQEVARYLQSVNYPVAGQH